MIPKIITGIIFAEFDYKVGPAPVAQLPPDLDKEMQQNVANVTIDIFQNEEAGTPKALFLVPFPAVNKRGLVKSMKWADERKRGGTSTGSLTLVFEEKDDAIFYKYTKDFEEDFEVSAQKLMDLRLNDAPLPKVQAEIKELLGRVNRLLEKLAAQELKMKDQLEAFPKPAKDGGKKADCSFKIIVVGDPSVGKSSTILQYTELAFTKSYIPTIGVNLTEKYIRYKTCVIQLFLWDLAGQSKFSTIRHQFYKGADGAVIVYDLTNRDTFESIPQWFTDIQESLKNNKSLKVVLCGNKSDIRDNIQVPTKEGKKMAKNLKVDFFETSALTGEHISDAFENLVKKLLASDKS